MQILGRAVIGSPSENDPLSHRAGGDAYAPLYTLELPSLNRNRRAWFTRTPHGGSFNAMPTAGRSRNGRDEHGSVVTVVPAAAGLLDDAGHVVVDEIARCDKIVRGLRHDQPWSWSRRPSWPQPRGECWTPCWVARPTSAGPSRRVLLAPGQLHGVRRPWTPAPGGTAQRSEIG